SVEKHEKATSILSSLPVPASHLGPGGCTISWATVMHTVCCMLWMDHPRILSSRNAGVSEVRRSMVVLLFQASRRVPPLPPLAFSPKTCTPGFPSEPRRKPPNPSPPGLQRGELLMLNRGFACPGQPPSANATVHAFYAIGGRRPAIRRLALLAPLATRGSLRALVMLPLCQGDLFSKAMSSRHAGSNWSKRGAGNMGSSHPISGHNLFCASPDKVTGPQAKFGIRAERGGGY
ncbi:hypothetical protein GQ53DRAFT_857390, partial [Thozetella sp. PMI_491]